MQCKLRLLSALLCLGAIECQSTLINKIDFSLDMPFDNLTAFYVDPEWIQLQLDEAAVERFGLLRSDQEDIAIDGMQQFVLLNQYHSKNGGAILGKNVVLSNNKGISIFYGNRVQEQGSSIYATESIQITKNRFPCLFVNNFPLKGAASQTAACIYADSIYMEDNPGLILFKNNHSKQNTNAGAIGFVSELIIRNSGPIVFENNQAYWGGAICSPYASNSNPCTLQLFADHGDIIFNNNMNADRQRNAIHFQPYYNAQFGAQKGYSIRFYDPIEAQHTTNTPTIFNPLPEHLGTILFSGITVPKNTTFTSTSLSSFFHNQVQINHGVVAVEDSACLFIHQLSGNGTLRLGSTSIIGTVNSSASNQSSLTIQHLALNIPSLLKQDALPPKIWISPITSSGNNTPPTFSEDANATITISGDLVLLDDDNNPPYDSMDLSEARNNIPLLYLCDNESPKITTNDFNIYAINQTSHYGYQGIWDPYWEQYTLATTNPSDYSSVNKLRRVLYANWLPTGYIPNPRNVTYFTANSLWVAAYNVQPFLSATPFKSTIFRSQGQATRMTHRQKNKDDIPGFHVNTKGYSVSLASSASLSNHQLSIQFGQDFTQTKEKDSRNRIASKNYTSAVQFLSSWLHDSIETSIKAAYAYGKHRVHNIYTDDTPAYSVGDFYTQTLGASLSTSLPISIPQLKSLIDPFLEFKGVHATFSNFSEKGPFKKVLRSFSTQNPLIEVSSAIGLNFSPITPPKYVDWSTSVAYQPTIYRQRPKIHTVLLASNGAWDVRGISPEKHAVLTNFNFIFSPFPHFHVEAEYKGNFASSAIGHFVTAGCSLYF